MTISFEQYKDWKTQKTSENFEKTNEDVRTDFQGRKFTHYQYTKQHTLDLWRISRLFLAVAITLSSAFAALIFSTIVRQWFLGKEITTIDVTKPEPTPTRPAQKAMPPQKPPAQEQPAEISNTEKPKKEVMEAAKKGRIDLLEKIPLDQRELLFSEVAITAAKAGQASVIRWILAQKDVEISEEMRGKVLKAYNQKRELKAPFTYFHLDNFFLFPLLSKEDRKPLSQGKSGEKSRRDYVANVVIARNTKASQQLQKLLKLKEEIERLAEKIRELKQELSTNIESQKGKNEKLEKIRDQKKEIIQGSYQEYEMLNV